MGAAGLPSSDELQRDKHYKVENVVIRVKLPQGKGSSSVFSVNTFPFGS